MGVAADTITDPMDQSQRALMAKIDRVRLPEVQVALLPNTFLYAATFRTM
jgi:hypothetical protein